MSQPHNPSNSNQVDAQAMVDELGRQIGQLHVERAMLHTQLAQKDEHIAQLQKLLQERQDGCVTPGADAASTGAPGGVVDSR